MTAFSQTERMAEDIIPFLSPPSTKPQNQQEGAISETPSTWLTLFAPSWRSSETLAHSNLTVTFPYECLVLAHASQLPKSDETITASLIKPPAPIPLAKFPQAWH